MISSFEPSAEAGPPLSAGQLSAFRSNGYVVVPGLFGRAEADQISNWADEILDWPEEPGKQMMYFEPSQTQPGERLLNRVENLPPYHAGFAALANSRHMLGACAQLFGEPAILFKDKINFKLPGAGGFEAHQDVQAGWSRYADVHITALVSLDRTTVEKGCLEMAVGLESRELIGVEWEPLAAADLVGADWISIESEPGDAVFFDSFATHRSAANLTRQPRRVLYFTYNRLSAGDQRAQYYADKRASYPPDIERTPGKEYRYRV